MRTLLLRGAMAAYRLRYWRPLGRAADAPRETQASVLAGILASQRNTEFGAAHGFGALTHQTFGRRVPVQDHESLRPLIERQRLTGAPALTTEPPLFYAQTSGSTGTPKYIPVTTPALRMHREEQALFSYLQYRARPEAFSGLAWGIMGAAIEARLESGHTVGSVSGHLYASLPGPLQSRLVVPPIVSTIEPYAAKYLVVLRLALETTDVTYLGSPNPSTFIRLLDLLNERRDELARSLESGSLDDLSLGEGPETPPQLPAEIRHVLAPRIRRRPDRARQIATNGRLTYADLWPRIRLLTTWTGGSCGMALEALRATLPRDCSVMELGYQSTEMRGTLPLDLDSAGGLPPLHHHYFEFVPVETWEAGYQETMGLADLVDGRRYYVIVTTMSGLYRYFMNDIVEVTGRFRRTPLLRFVQKGRGVTSLTGEKLYEGQALDAVQDAAHAHGIRPVFVLLVAEQAGPRYHLYLEADTFDGAATDAFAQSVDRRLGDLNIEYRSKRASGRLAPLVVSPLRTGAGEDYKAHCVRAGQREGQFKPAVLQHEGVLTWPARLHVAG